MHCASADITVIIPFYNREEFIDEAVESVLSQTLKPREILIVNDCSRASARRTLDRYADRCRILDLPQNVGLAGARNAAITQACGEFIALLDDDDIWMPTKLETQYRYIQAHPGCTGVHTAVWLMRANKPDYRWKLFKDPPLLLSEALTHRQWVIPSSLLIRTQAARAIGGFDPSFRENEDRDFVIRCCAAGYRLDGLDEPLVRFRRTGQSHLAGRHARMFRSHVRVCVKHRSLYYRVFGLGGIFNFLLESFYHSTHGYVVSREDCPTLSTKILHGIMWRLHQVLPVKYIERPDYEDPVTCAAL